MKRNFNEWIKTFKENIATFDFFTDFNKVYKNVDDIKIELNILNSLIGSKNIESDFKDIILKYPQVLDAIPSLIAKRDKKIQINEIADELVYIFDEPANSIDEYLMFMRKTGIFNLLENNKISNLVDYVTGIEVGMDTNGRKNRVGHLMEDLVEEFLKSKGLIKNQNYFKEMTKTAIQKRFNLDLNPISNDGKTEKRFDYVVYLNDIVYAIEVNFYSSSGSKLNETARSYKQLFQESQKVDKFKFIWITDGIGWNNAKRNLEETFDMTDDIANLNDLANGYLDEYFNL